MEGVELAWASVALLFICRAADGCSADPHPGPGVAAKCLSGKANAR